MAFDELEKRAVQHANEAILLERKGDRQSAISKYERAIEILNRLCHLYPKSNHAKIYSEYISQYKERIGFLKGGEPSSSLISSGPSKDFVKITKANSPNVTWDNIADLSAAGVNWDGINDMTSANINWDGIRISGVLSNLYPLLVTDSIP